MLVIRRRPVRAVGQYPKPDDDRGAVLVVVVILMLVGVVAATAIAASVVFTIGANVDNRSNTQAFIAAESGRDAARAQLTQAIDSNGDLHCNAATLVGTGTSPNYSFTIHSTTDAARPSSATDAGVSQTCPTLASKYVVIRATGMGPGGDAATIDSVYPWKITHIEQPAGTMAYFDGEFKATKSTYKGDLVIRDTAPYTCNNDSMIDGDLWAVKGNVVLSTGCQITGSIYAFGTVTSSSSDITIGGDIIAGGQIAMKADGVTVGGKIHSGNDVKLTNTGSTSATVGGTVIAAAAIPTIEDKWRKPDGTALVGTKGAAPVFEPTLADVFEVTRWLEVTSNGVWGSASTTPSTTTYTTCSASTIRTELAKTGAGRALFDMSSCLDPSGKVVNVELAGTAFSVARDAVFYVPASKQMNLKISAPVVRSGDPQMLFVHADGNPGDGAPTSCTSQDSLSISASVEPRMMIYSPCGLNGGISVAFTGQMYTANSGNHLVLSSFTCSPMGWLPAFGNLSCGVKGDGGALDTSKDVASLDTRSYQTEVTP
ncbi:hypothetical protein AB0N64_09080 [Microbacterium sp. NPDC089318]